MGKKPYIFQKDVFVKDIDYEKEAEDLQKELNEFVQKQKSEPIKLKLSHNGFPLCPICNGEFKDKEAIKSHLKKNKQELNKLTIGFNHSSDNSSGKSFWEINATLSRGSVSNTPLIIAPGGVIEHNKDKIKELFGDRINNIKLYDEIKDEKYKEWKGEVKKDKGRRENPVPQKIRFEILKRDNFTCQYCGKKSPEVKLEVDHIEPYSKTKNNSHENLITACEDCNRGKRTEEVI